MLRYLHTLYKQMRCTHVWKTKGKAKKDRVSIVIEKCIECGKDRQRKE